MSPSSVFFPDDLLT
ncbi:hypothetical protein A2U01_0048948, partial [Trifolium medium]|nr:hypothetical protein [Trifolium medium]